MPINQKNFRQRISDAFSEAMKLRLHRGLAVVLMLSLISSGLYAVNSTGEILKPTEWYFVTENGGGKNIQSPTRNNIIRREFITPESPGCDYREIARLNELHIVPPAIGYRGVWLCNAAGITGDEFGIRRQQFTEKVDALYSSYHEEIAGKILTSFACGFLAWLFVVFSFVTVNWIRSGQKS